MYVNTGIMGSYVVEAKPGESGPRLRVQTDGINFARAWAEQAVDEMSVTANDVSAMLATFGVEAARATLVAEVWLALVGSTNYAPQEPLKMSAASCAGSYGAVGSS